MHIAGAFASIGAVGILGGAASPAALPNAPRPHSVEGSPDPRDLDLADLVPSRARLNHVWYIPAGKTTPQVVTAWQFRDLRPVLGWDDPRRFVVTLWNPERVTRASARWVPHTLIRGSPFPLSGRSIRLADVTRDGHDDLLVTVACSDCNHGTAVASIYATFGDTVRRIYGTGYLGVAKGRGHDPHVQGRVIIETFWGARRGIVWFDQPGGGSSVCCPTFRLQTFMRWTPRGWRTINRRRVSPTKDRLLRHARYP